MNRHDANNAIEAIALDTDRDELREACSSRWKSPLSPDDTLHLPLRLPKSYDNSREILGWVSRRWLYNIPRSLETRGYRPLGRVALVDHCPARARTSSIRKLQRLAALAGSTDAAGEARDATIRVVLLAGTGGGTGAGMAIDIANAVKSLAADSRTSSRSPRFLGLHVLREQQFVAARGRKYVFAAHRIESCDGPRQRKHWRRRRRKLNCSNRVKRHSIVSIGCRPHARTTGLRIRPMLSTPRPSTWRWKRTPDARAVLRSCRAVADAARAVARPIAHSQETGLRVAGRSKTQILSANWLPNWPTRSSGTGSPTTPVPIGSDWCAKSNKLPQRRRSDNGDRQLRSPPPRRGRSTTRRRWRSAADSRNIMSLEFASEVLRQIQRQLESRDDRGRPLILARDAKLIADTARAVVASLAGRVKHDSRDRSRFADSPMLRPLIAAASRRVLGHAGLRNLIRGNPSDSCPPGAVDELIQIECQALLEESLAQPDLAAAITALVDLDKATALDAGTRHHRSASMRQRPAHAAVRAEGRGAAGSGGKTAVGTAACGCRPRGRR